MIRAAVVVLAVLAAGVAGTAAPVGTDRAIPATHRGAVRLAAAPLPLAGVRISLDPGHQLGNHHFPQQISRLVPAGGFRKACDTTGTSTNWGYPEATVNFQLASLVRSRLQALGATVVMTRTRNSEGLWGPCVNTRGAFGRKAGAVLQVGLHADGAPGSDHGFHVIAPTSRRPWTNAIAAASLRLAKALRSGFDGQHLARSTYIGGGTALSIRSDLATLNLAGIPVALIEIGNMRNAADARRMTSARGRSMYAAAVVAGIRAYLRR
ncbi:MAG: cell wall hydrolase/autolysin [Marmoricola sp.]|nr:cell wall hydrolase/autolysin [Marmoricola sp.]